MSNEVFIKAALTLGPTSNIYAEVIKCNVNANIAFQIFSKCRSLVVSEAVKEFGCCTSALFTHEQLNNAEALKNPCLASNTSL